MKLQGATLLILCVAMTGMSGERGGNRVVIVGEATRPGASEPALNGAAAGMVVYFDPATGRIVENPSPTAIKQLAAALAPAVSTSDEGLVEVPGQVPGGGVKVDLQGRFQNTVVATVDENGKLSAPCVPGSPRPSGRAGEGE